MTESPLDNPSIAAIMQRSKDRDLARTAAIYKMAKLLAEGVSSEKDPEERHKIAFAAMMAVRNATFEDALHLAKDMSTTKLTEESTDPIGDTVGNA